MEHGLEQLHEAWQPGVIIDAAHPNPGPQIPILRRGAWVLIRPHYQRYRWALQVEDRMDEAVDWKNHPCIAPAQQLRARAAQITDDQRLVHHPSAREVEARMKAAAFDHLECAREAVLVNGRSPVQPEQGLDIEAPPGE